MDYRFSEANKHFSTIPPFEIRQACLSPPTGGQAKCWRRHVLIFIIPHKFTALKNEEIPIVNQNNALKSAISLQILIFLLHTFTNS